MSFAEQTDTPKVVGSRNEAASPVHGSAAADRVRRRLLLAYSHSGWQPRMCHTGSCCTRWQL